MEKKYYGRPKDLTGFEIDIVKWFFGLVALGYLIIFWACGVI